MADDLLPLPAAAKYLGLSAKSLRVLCAAGRVPYYTPGPEQVKRYLRVSDLDAYRESTRVEVKRPKVETARMRRIGRPDGRPQRWS